PRRRLPRLRRPRPRLPRPRLPRRCRPRPRRPGRCPPRPGHLLRRPRPRKRSSSTRRPRPPRTRSPGPPLRRTSTRPSLTAPTIRPTVRPDPTGTSGTKNVRRADTGESRVARGPFEPLRSGDKEKAGLADYPPADLDAARDEPDADSLD